MNKRQEKWVRTKWVPALLSGDYSQGQGKLRLGGNVRCCLGVACDLADPDAWVVGKSPTGMIKKYEWVDPLTGDGHESFLPLSVQKKSGMNADGGFFVSDFAGFPIDHNKNEINIAGSLSRLNDRGKPFTLIAELILWILDHPEQAGFRKPGYPGTL